MKHTILAAVDDIFFASKIRATAEALAVEISFARTIDALLRIAREKKPHLVLVDLHNQKVDAIELAEQMRSDEALKDIPLLGFFSHVQTELQKDALAAGYTQVIPRSVFSRDLAKILTGSAN